MTTTETKAAHTPGPWIVCETEQQDAVLSIEQDRMAITDEPSIVADVDLCGDGISQSIGRANARLIAAAPELLAACQELLEICRWKCSPSDEVVLSNGKSNHQAMIDAEAILSAAVEARNPDLTD